MPSLYYSNHGSGHSIMSDNWEADALTSMLQNREVIILDGCEYCSNSHHW